MKAILKNYRQAPRKVRLVADLVRGKSINEARKILDFNTKKAAKMVKKVVNSAVANARENDGKSPQNLYIKKITVDEGITLKRLRARAMGRGVLVRKRSSNIAVILDEKSKKGENIKNVKEKEKVS